MTDSGNEPSLTATVHGDDDIITNNNNNFQQLPLWLKNFPYEACVASDEPTPLELVKERLPLALMATATQMSTNQLAPSCLHENHNIKLLINYIFLSTTKVQNKDSPLSLREIQAQIMLRLELYSLAGDTFLHHYTQFVTRHMKKQLSSLHDNQRERRRYRQILKQHTTFEISRLQILINDVIELLSLAIFRLKANTLFATFCRDCLAQHWFISIPKVMNDILDWFEIRNPWEELEKTHDQAINDLYLSPVKQPSNKKKNKQPLSSSFVSSMQQEEVDDTLSVAGTDDMSCLDQPLLTFSNTMATTNTALPNHGSSSSCDTIQALVQHPLATNLTTTATRRRNSLLKDGGKPRLLASHFNTKLSNVSTLFRQVQMTTTAPKQPPFKHQPQQQPSRQARAWRPSNTNTNKSCASTTKRKLLATRHDHDDDVSKQVMTDLKRSKKEQLVSNTHDGGVPFACSTNSPTVKTRVRRREGGESPRVVFETPLKSTKHRSHHPRTPLGVSNNCIVQETPTKDVAVAVTKATTSSPFWDRAKLLAEASQVLRRNQRKQEDTSW
jgi:hypothetical protein